MCYAERVTKLELRPYQREAIDAVRKAHERGVQRPAQVLPTGAGKTVVFTHLGAEHAESYGRQLYIAHRQELVYQAYEKACSVNPSGPDGVGIVQGTENQTSAPIICASIWSLSPRRRSQLKDVGLVVIDEAHHATTQTYRDVMEHFGCFDRGGAYTLGVTATMSRGDSARLGDVWEEIVYSRTIGEMIRESYLVKPRGVRVQIAGLDLTKIKKTAGDLQAAGLGAALEATLAPAAVARAYREHAADRQGILFAPTVRAAELFRDALIAEGFTAALVCDKTPKDERAEIIRLYRSGKIQVLCNAMVFTEGTDLPMCSAIVVCRMTGNAGLFVQMVGRGLRLWPGKTDCVVLDVTGASTRHSLITSPNLQGDDGRDDRDEFDDLQTAADLIEMMEDGETGDAPEDDDGSFGADGQLISTEVDLFHTSRNLWMQTKAGIWFLPAGRRYIAVVRSRERGWDVVEMDAQAYGRSSFVIQGVDDLGYAMGFAEADVTSAERGAATREAHWRGRPVSTPTADMARSAGIVVERHATEGEVLSSIIPLYASMRIDPYLPEYAR